jgi:NADH:ubiquinone oxidoreductase subunit 5 (subunit L)/multisubunit Na+/H+ antiporter MnhA subunit
MLRVGTPRKEVVVVPTETLPANGRVASTTVPTPDPGGDDGFRQLALQHLADVRKFTHAVAIYVLSILVLAPVWVVTQYYEQDGWPKHLSTRSRYAGDWDPWIIWVAAVGAVIVGIYAYRAFFRRAETEADVQREIERLKSAG